MADALIFDHVRTPRGRGKKDGALYEVPAVRLAAQPLEALRNRNDLDTKLVDDVVLGCVDPIGEAGGDIARAAVFAAGYDAGVPGVQINRFCASGLDAVNFAASQVMSGQHDLVIAGGAERCAERREDVHTATATRHCRHGPERLRIGWARCGRAD